MLKSIAISTLNTYQKYVRIVLPESCRFYPSCSEYAKQALLKYGFLKGVVKGLARILRCHPFSGKSGYDPLL